MDKKYGEFVGVDNVYAAIVTEDSADNYITAAPEYFAPASEISAESEIENTPTYYDNVPGFNYVTEGVTTLTCTFSGVPAPLAAKYLGKHYDAATGRVLDTGIPTPPDVALAFRFNKGPDGYRYYQYLKGNFSGGTEEAGTKTNSVDIRTYQMTYTAVATTHKWPIGGEQKPLKRIFADTTDAAFTGAANWFSQVQTPETAVPPTAFNLVSSVPTDDATGVAVDASVALTFNNAISEITAILIGPDLAPAPVQITFDATRKVVTVKPSANLTAASKYALALAQVTDAFGQTIKDRVITFTTA